MFLSHFLFPVRCKNTTFTSWIVKILLKAIVTFILVAFTFKAMTEMKLAKLIPTDIPPSLESVYSEHLPL